MKVSRFAAPTCKKPLPASARVGVAFNEKTVLWGGRRVRIIERCQYAVLLEDVKRKRLVLLSIEDWLASAASKSSGEEAKKTHTFVDG